MLNLKVATVTTYLKHVYNIEKPLKKSDAPTEQLQEDLLVDDDNELDSDVEETTKIFLKNYVLLLCRAAHN